MTAEGDDLVVAHNAPPVRIRTMFARFWPDTRPYRGRMLLSLLLIPVEPALATGSVYLFKVLVDDVLTPHDYQLFLPIALAYVAFAVVGGLVSFIDEYLTAWVGERFVTSLRVRLFAHLQRLSVGWFERRQVGDLISRLTGDIATIEQLVLTGVNLALTYAFQVLFFAGAMFLLNWHLALTSLIAAPAFLLLSRAFSRRIQAASRERRRRSGSITAVAEENLGNIPLVQAYDRADHEVERFAKENRAAFSAQMLAIRLEALFGPFSSLVECIGVLAVTGVAVYELAQGAITLGGLLAFLAYLGQLYGPVQGFAGLSNTLFAASAGAERIIEVLDERPAVTEPQEPHPLGRAVGAIRFDKVWFTYDGTEQPALRGIDLRLAPGRKVAVVGASGAGKSTLTKLLLRSYDPDRGRVTLDGIDLRELSLSDLRRNISTVLQETLVFDGTVAENIRWGKPDATDAEVRAAAEAADAHGFIARLDQGYDTRVGQRGRLLSGGQRQRLAIARAIIRDAPLLLLDEPTTGLDAASGQRVLAPLRRLMAGRTTIIISHDLHTVTDADEIIVLDGGAVSAVGRHEELLATSPIYAHLYALHQAPTRMTAAPPPIAARPAGPPAPTRPRPRGVLAAVVDVATTPIWMVPGAASRGALSRSSAPPAPSQAAAGEPALSAGSRPSRPPSTVMPAGPPVAAAPTSAPSNVMAAGPPAAAAPTSAPLPPVTATTPLRAATRGRHARPSTAAAPAAQRPARHALAEAPPTVTPPRAIGSAPVTAPGLAHPLPGPRAPHDVPS
jgi:ATP-binding cassette, subfamily B, bacterial